MSEVLQARDQAAYPAALAIEAAWFRGWLFDHALPVWWRLGADHVGGGYHDALDRGGGPSAGPRRARVQCRQSFTYAVAGEMGWTGPWREAARHGWSHFVRRFRRPDGLFRTSVAPDGAPIDEQAYLYDQAFALLALAALRRGDPAGDDYRGQARDLLRALFPLRHAAGGFREAGAHPFQSNAHMHLFEAAMAWLDLGEPAFGPLAEEIAELARIRFIDADGGFLREFFDADWRPAPSDDGQLVEPGHQFEWAWLLTRWAARTGEAAWADRARRLFEAGSAGICPVRSVVIGGLWDNLTPRDATARLWPQTEYVKAAASLGRFDHLHRGAVALRRYLQTPLPGLWWDKLDAQGRFAAEPAPASSFYHIIQACQVIIAAGAGRPVSGLQTAWDVMPQGGGRAGAPALGSVDATSDAN